MLSLSRTFFDKRRVLEVDTPLIAASAIDAHLDPIPVIYAGRERHYLITSPEFSMKRLLMEGLGDIYQLSHVFRDGEKGERHNPEFTMVEWYRCGFSMEKMIQETLDYLQLFVEERTHHQLSYSAAFMQHAGVDPELSSDDALRQALIERGEVTDESCRATLIDLIFGLIVEPELGHSGFTVLTDFPLEQAELARTRVEGKRTIAERFEIFLKGYELANGYGELKDPVEHRKRFEQHNTERLKLQKDALPLNEAFLQDLEHKRLPDCCGVAVGFDRLMMLRHQTTTIADILPFQ